MSSTDKGDSPLRVLRELLSPSGSDADGWQLQAPRIAIVAGSGLSELGDDLADLRSVSFRELFAHADETVPGHAGEWRVGALCGVPIHFLAGRRHDYEGVSAQQLTAPIRCLAILGVRLIVLTNAAGGLSPRLHPGDLMLIHDQINLSFRNPLLGPNADDLGPRFPDMSDPFDPAAAAMMRKAAQREGIPLEEGVYAQVLGPNYETPAEVEMLRRLGAHAVGMSTVPEVLAARHAGMHVLGISLITNDATGKAFSTVPTTHEEVMSVAGTARRSLRRLLEAALPRLNRLANSPAYAGQQETYS